MNVSERAKLFEKDKSKSTEQATKQFEHDPIIKKNADASKIDIITRNVSSVILSLRVCYVCH